MKHCARCGQDKPREDFYPNTARHDGLSGYCRSCHNEMTTAGRTALRDRAIELLGGPVCSGCGHTDARVLTIDHREGGGTEHRRKVGPYKILRDVVAHPEKYQVLCWNCQFLKKLENGEHGRRFLTETVTL